MIAARVSDDRDGVTGMMAVFSGSSPAASMDPESEENSRDEAVAAASAPAVAGEASGVGKEVFDRGAPRILRAGQHRNDVQTSSKKTYCSLAALYPTGPAVT